MSKILFINQPSVGHLNTLLSIATQMKSDGAEVGFLMPGARGIKTNIAILDTGFSLPDRVRKNGMECSLMRPAIGTIWGGLLMPFTSGYEEIEHSLGMFTAGIAHYARCVLKFVEMHRPDVIVTDFAFPATSLAADVAKIPYVVIYHSGLPFRGAGIPPFGSGLPIGAGAADEKLVHAYEQRENRVLAKLDKKVNAARRFFGLAPDASDMLRRPYSPWLNLIAGAEILEAPRDNLTENTFFVGPCFGKRVETDDFPWEILRPDAYKIYVSLGTIFNNKPDVFLKIMRALDQPDYQVIVSAGGAYAKLQKSAIPRNAAIFRSVPQVRLLSHIDLFLSHGGNNSTNEALAHGKPIVVMPVGGEQGDNASRVEYLGVGKRLDVNKFSERQLAEVVKEIRNNPAFADRAHALRDGLTSSQGAITASRCISWVASHGKPLKQLPG